MNNEKLDHAIEVHDEMAVLDDILSAANNQPYLEFSFFYSATGKNHTYTIKNEALIYEVLKLIRDQKERLEKVFQEL